MSGGKTPVEHKRDQRLHPRIELFATVELRGLDEVLILSLRNVSLGGAFLSADGNDLSGIRVGSEHELAVFEGEDTKGEIVVRARVVRKESNGLALSWIGEDTVFAIAGLIGQRSS